jgi:hypothetical protein
MEHTPEPWVNINNTIESHANGKMDKEYVGYLEDFSKSDGRRVVACVNACKLMDIETLEMIGRMIADKKLTSTPMHIIDKVEAENKRMRDALECIAKHAKDSVTPVDWRNIVLIIGDIARAALWKE